MLLQYRSAALVCALLGVALTAPAASRSRAELGRIILRSRHLGAHGMGYNDHSLIELSQAVGPDDIPSLISLMDNQVLRVGAQFALASQCGAAIEPVRETAAQNQKFSMLDADDILDLIAGFEGCTEEMRTQARETRTEVDSIRRNQQSKRAAEVQEKAADDARIQKNALKMNDPGQRKTLTRAERLEVFRRSVKAVGLEHPQTPAQKALADRMYRTMVLDELPASNSQ